MKSKKDYGVLNKVEKVDKITKSIFYFWTLSIAIYIIYKVYGDFLSRKYGVNIIDDLNFWVSRILEELIKATYVTFPIFVLIFAITTFIVSYTIFSSRNFKNILIFVFIILLAYLTNSIFGPLVKSTDAPLSPQTSFLLMIGIMGLTSAIISLLQRQITLESDETLKSSLEENINDLINEYLNPKSFNKKDEDGVQKRRERKKIMGVVVSGMIAIIIALIFLLRVKNYEFVTSGIILGLLLSGLFIKGEKIALGLLYFVDPEDAENIFKTYKVQFAQSLMNINRDKAKDVIILEDEQSKTLELNKVLEIKRKLKKLADNKRLDLIKAFEKKIDSKEFTLEEIEERLNELDREIPKYLKNENSLRKNTSLLLDDFSEKYSVSEKINRLLGLNTAEIKLALSESIIEKEQAYIWEIKNMKTIRKSLIDFQNGAYTDYANLQLTISETMISYLEDHKYVVTQLSDKISKAKVKGIKLDLTNLKGTDELQILDFSTKAEDYVAVLKINDKGEYLILGIFKKVFFQEAEES